MNKIKQKFDKALIEELELNAVNLKNTLRAVTYKKGPLLKNNG
jgi:hypothetical protein